MTERIHHNHITRDIKPVGICPVCDGYHAQAARKGLSATPNPLQTRSVGVEVPDPRIEAAAQAIARAAFTADTRYSELDQDGREFLRGTAMAALAAADSVDPLRQPGHRVEIQQFSWTLQHPLECRPNLLDCPLTRALQRFGVSGIDDGTYAVELTEDGSLFFPDEATR